MDGLVLGPGPVQVFVGLLVVGQAPEAPVEQVLGRAGVPLVVAERVCELEVLVTGEVALYFLQHHNTLKTTPQHS